MNDISPAKPPRSYWDFHLDEVAHHAERNQNASRALVHARVAEELMAAVESGTCVITPPAMSAAQVHATLAGAFATLALSEQAT